jgi:uncharacterized protein with HEPN domain
MSDMAPLQERLRLILSALERIPRRCTTIEKPEDFLADENGLDRLDAICMILIAAGEEFKNIDRQTKGELFSRYPQVAWRGAMGLRDVLAHGYLDVDVDQLFNVCKTRIPSLIDTLKQMIKDLESSQSP